MYCRDCLCFQNCTEGRFINSTSYPGTSLASCFACDPGKASVSMKPMIFSMKSIVFGLFWSDFGVFRQPAGADGCAACAAGKYIAGGAGSTCILWCEFDFVVPTDGSGSNRIYTDFVVQHPSFVAQNL